MTPSLYPKLRHPTLTWFLTVITLGLYSFYWVQKVSDELNYAEEKDVFPIRFWRGFLIGLAVLYFIALLVYKLTNVPLLFYPLCLGWIWLVSHVFLTLSNYVEKKQKKFKVEKKLDPRIVTVLSFVWLVGMISLQTGINQVIYYERAVS